MGPARTAGGSNPSGSPTHIRDVPSLPAEASNPELPTADAVREDVAVVLPATHRAWKYCYWSFDTDEALYEHAEQHHAP